LASISEQVEPATRWKLDLVARVSASEVFKKSPRLRELLTYICEQAIQNHPEDLKEHAIGRHVFGRAADYSPSDDNIVRVEVRQLRKRLEEYFAGEGKAEPIAITIPKGGYSPEFAPRSAPPPMAPEPTPQGKLPVGRRTVWIACLAVLLIAAVVPWWLLRGRSSQASNRNTQRGLIWQAVFDGRDDVTVVCADSSLVMAQAVTRRPISLDDYIQRDYIRSNPQLKADQVSLLETLQRWQFTDITDVRLVQRMSRMNSDYWDRAQVRSAKIMQLQDFKNGNIVILGSNRSNPWNLLFEPQLNFRFGFDYDLQQHSAYIRNVAPQAGEKAVYRAAGVGEVGDVYSTIALVPNLNRTGYVLIVAGTTAEGTEAAGEFLMNRETADGLTRELLRRNNGHLPYFEALLRSNAFAGVAQGARVIAIRILPGS
jgi:hypothetical protein